MAVYANGYLIEASRVFLKIAPLAHPGRILKRYKTLSREELKIIETMTGDAYNQVLSTVASIP